MKRIQQIITMGGLCINKESTIAKQGDDQNNANTIIYNVLTLQIFGHIFESQT